MEPRKISVLVVDDSALMRNLVGKIVESAEDLSLAGTAMNGEFALQKIPRLNPDIIVLDLEMPRMNGIAFLQARREQNIDIPVIILSSLAQKGAKITMEALALGASDFIAKPSGAVSQDLHMVSNQLIAMIRSYGGAHLRARGVTPRHPPEGTASAGNGKTATSADVAPAPAPPEKPKEPGPLEVIALGISTGGPNALRRLFAEIEGDIAVPVLVVQHMPPGFTTEFAASLNRVSALEVREATDGDILKPGRVLVAPGDYHMEVRRRSLATTIALHQDKPCNGHRPSAGLLFKSVASVFGNRAMGIIMTGMGRDGAWEIGEIYRAGGMTLGQDEQSSVVYGMPRVAWESGHIHRQVSLEEMAGTISTLARELR
ncbi:MAG: chemotaxis response regulator protein-glutamate methylesterase [Spirochaetaceae bacterium]|nr:MAG: chemotaxis response regulator protein-glutamate methylesterase [Spirochaetaceae bacterium]